MSQAVESGDGATATREAILGAARARFERYGFGKTTMAEIAADCAMSAANLYRYFESKSAIAAAGAERWLDQAEQSLRAAVADRRAPVQERLRRLVTTRIALLDDLAARHSHLDELIADVCARRPDLTERHGQQVCEIVDGILRDGVARGGLRMLDTAEAARAICWATAAFDRHEIVRAHDRATLERAAESVIALIVDGLAPATETLETAQS